ncbi:FcoT family thioesterase [Saccharothrix variisporea]|uniref:(2E)-enoyl-[ACP] glycyltransferase n=1 Tax=Saccharothrix variisporea TaxID=543527 RepID=A0A495X9X7_9PSEU|nr:FcoT family thioesterase [Saccharothrix variisporea]RKT70186.1 FcoT-like thioesterase-like protein [Saccharothrix variisporea]
MTTSPVENTSLGFRTFPNDPALLSDVLRPYAKPKTEYLKSATVDVANGLASAQGEFAIPYSCYIDDTGHLNSVEVNICFNQLMYYLIAKCIQEDALPAFRAWSMADYWAKQLPDMLIANFKSNFRRPIDSSSFSGEVSFAEFSERNRSKPVQIIDMPWRFWDANGGIADGEVRMALVNPPGMRFQADAA